jgi:hypothetical protein
MKRHFRKTAAGGLQQLGAEIETRNAVAGAQVLQMKSGAARHVAGVAAAGCIRFASFEKRAASAS